MTRLTGRIAALTAAAFLLTACGGGNERRDVSDADRDYAATLMEQLIDAQPGEVIEIPAGVFVFDRSLSLTVDGVTIRGAGMDETVLSFSGQTSGAEGLLVTASDFTIEDLAIEDTRGDALKVNEGDNIVIRRVRTEWTNGPDTENGAYGIYPVQTTNVLIDGAVAIGASDAGIYVGQSRNVIIRNSRAEFNVAGIEVENTVGADVYDNVATNNTGGILVFNMPNLPQPGYQTRVYNNRVFGNNTGNFGHPGTPVASVPAGSGVVINSNDQVEIFDNEISDHRTANIIISSVHSTGFSDLGTQENFDPYPEAIYIHGNTFGEGGGNPDHLELQALRIAMFGITGNIPDVLWDGYVDPAKMEDGALPADLRICIDNGDAQMLNVDFPNGNDNPHIVEDTACTLDRLPAISLPG
ncbi:parallel beta-helix domain-containing protein [Hyphobacterium marinum]|uniref:Parallel beta-helix domain-containing protein n=1 Tax=Hyphobacterium marinum TaxID=3116574 RepID=A0ABU7LYX9_9PROT|nr:parallel beta-helix domain-containing protein [Hyphobacterium sp. Y6023]MEE2566766.1 parallel beta-helix domain-containing protein [Hyphobacterium sp. Y6023]